MNPIKKVILGLENTSTITLPIERVFLLELNGADVLTTPLPDFKRKRPELKIRFAVQVDDFGYYSKISEEQDRWFIFESDRYNLVDILSSMQMIPKRLSNSLGKMVTIGSITNSKH